ncbi:hypothetical protein MFFC18_32160 [Mariniblastus fucicola]|uniref:DUF6268 domain-containing protein n=2 Tax=Mariniblastus fucicola TaxID=980251 RepID=A0A5B9PCT2_9BACT|nr:hypothetical protein MFFC18_32160 [Mariniblastus fucicola]
MPQRKSGWTAQKPIPLVGALAVGLLCMLITDAIAAAPRMQPQSAKTDSASTSQRPRGIPIGLESAWIVDSETGLSTQSANLKLPLLRGFGTPPPIVKIGFAYTDLSTPDSLGLPNDLYEYSIGLSTIRKIRERWMLRTMLGMNFATDNENRSSDAWRFTGGVFAIHQKSPQLSWTFGAIALGRSDLPVVPAIGAVWLPRPGTRVDLILPNPKVNFLVADNGQRQQWCYLGGGLNGNTWGYERPGFGDDTLTYSDLRIVAGWESRPSAPANQPYVPGRKFGIEAGYAFSRDLEFEDEAIELSLDDALIFRINTRY